MCLAIPGKIVEVREGPDYARTGKVDFGSVLREVNLAFVPEANVGDYVVVHVGVALSIVDEEEAQQVFEYLRVMGELNELAEDHP
jgi:hydrogenase expression/formation protein HypC